MYLWATSYAIKHQLWLVQAERSDKLIVTQTGSGGLGELQEILDPTKASYAYVRVSFSNDKESVREKFIFVTWIGPNCKIMRKGKVHAPVLVSYYQA